MFHFYFLGTKVRLICYGMMKQVLHLSDIKFSFIGKSVRYAGKTLSLLA